MMAVGLNRLIGSLLPRKLNVRTVSSFQTPLFFQLSPNLYAEPLKKKKRLDPLIIKQREEKRRKRLEKQIRKLEKNTKQLKPLEECEVPMEIINDKSRQRKINVPKETENQRLSLLKSWTAYKMRQHLKDVQLIDRIVYSNQRALDELKLESEELYNAAIQIDENLIPIKIEGPSETPPIEEYPSPDGEYTDVSKKWG